MDPNTLDSWIERLGDNKLLTEQEVTILVQKVSKFQLIITTFHCSSLFLYNYSPMNVSSQFIIDYHFSLFAIALL